MASGFPRAHIHANAANRITYKCKHFNLSDSFIESNATPPGDEGGKLKGVVRMKLIPKLKQKLQVNADDTTADLGGIKLLGGLEPLAKLVRPVRARAAAHAKALDALGQARFKLRHLKNATPPDMALTVQRELIVDLDDAESLARFDAEHTNALKTEAEARVQFLRDKELMPARIAALEKIVEESARRCADELPVFEIEEEAQKLFEPYSTQLVAAAKVFAQARSEARAVSYMLTRALSIRQYDITGQSHVQASPELAEQFMEAAILPRSMFGVNWETLEELNHQANKSNEVLITQMEERLKQFELGGVGLTTYQAKGPNDDRQFYAPEPLGPSKRPEINPHSLFTRVVVDVA
jgi:hypothetical protein